MRNDAGSVGVVEMAFILPLTISICMTLIYFLFSLFSYAYTYCVADEILNCFENNATGNGLYWYICSSPYNEEQMTKSVESAEKLLSTTKILPGSNYSFKVMQKRNVMDTNIKVHIDYTYFGKSAFSIDLDKNINRPAEFITLSEFFIKNEELNEDINGIKEALGGFLQ